MEQISPNSHVLSTGPWAHKYISHCWPLSEDKGSPVLLSRAYKDITINQHLLTFSASSPSLLMLCVLHLLFQSKLTQTYNLGKFSKLHFPGSFKLACVKKRQSRRFEISPQFSIAIAVYPSQNTPFCRFCRVDFVQQKVGKRKSYSALSVEIL